MIKLKEFYFVRHGQTDHNLIEGFDKEDHSAEIPLNNTGRAQACAIEPLIATLPVDTIVASPMRRAQETKEIITPKIQAPHYVINELQACTMKQWKKLRELKMGAAFPRDQEIAFFLERAISGLNLALSMPGTPLIVAHGEIHWAACFLMQIKQHDWSIHNCGIVRFSIQEKGKWRAQRL